MFSAKIVSARCKMCVIACTENLTNEARSTHLLDEDPVSTLRDTDLGIAIGSLAFLVKRHDDNRCAVPPYELGILDKLLLANLEGDRVYNALALQALKTSLRAQKCGVKKLIECHSGPAQKKIRPGCWRGEPKGDRKKTERLLHK